MPRYLVERTFPAGLDIPSGQEGSDLHRDVIERNADEGVTWVHSYVSEDRRRTFCVYDARSPEAIRRTAARNGLPVERITQVRVLDPYAYSPREELTKTETGHMTDPKPTEKHDSTVDEPDLEVEEIADLEMAAPVADDVRGGRCKAGAVQTQTF